MAMRWPVEVSGVETQSVDSGPRPIGGQAVWRDDRQSFALLLEYQASLTRPTRSRLQWIGDRHGQCPTIAALEAALTERGIRMDERSARNLGVLGEFAREAVGPAWLVRYKTRRHAALAVMHPDGSLTRLSPERVLSADGFNWGYRGHGTLEAADAAIRSCYGADQLSAAPVLASIEVHRRDFAGSIMAGLPDEFSLPLDELVRWIQTREPFHEEGSSGRTQTLARVLDAPESVLHRGVERESRRPRYGRRIER